MYDFTTVTFHRVASTPELATNFIDCKQMAGMTTMDIFYLNIFIFEIYTQQWYESDF